MIQAENQRSAAVVTLQKRKEILQSFHRTHFRLSDNSTPAVPIPPAAEPPPQLNSTFSHAGHSSCWQLGFDKPTLKTETADRFSTPKRRDWGEAKAKGANRDLYDQHFQLGYQSGATESVMREAYQRYECHRDDINYSKKHKDRKLVLGCDKAEYQSAAQSSLTPKQSDKLTTSEIRIDLKKRNEQASLLLGSDSKLLPNSTTASAFQPLQGVRATLIPQQTSIALGTDPSSFDTSAHLTRSHVPLVKPEFQASLLCDLRKSHFRLGSYTDPQPASAPLPLPAVAKTKETSLTYVSSLTLGNSSDAWESSYGWSHKSHPVENQAGKLECGELATASHVSLGHDSSTLKSTAHLHFAAPHSELKHKFPRGQVSKSSVALGTFKRDWSKDSQTYGEGASHPLLTQSCVNEARKHHFQYGCSEPTFEVSSKLQVPKRFEKARLDADTIKKLTSTSTQIGFDDERVFDSTYANAFQWVQSHADDQYQVSFK